MSTTLKYISESARERCWKPGRRGEGGGGREVAESESDAGRNVPWYAGEETGDAYVG